MKRFTWVLPFMIISFCVGLTITNHLNFKPKKKGGIPGNPGWYSQWYELKKSQDGSINWSLYKDVKDQISEIRQTRSGGIFTNVIERGPNNVGGRTRALLVDYSDPMRLFAGGISGGLWVSPDRGLNWSPVNDDMANLSITSITQSPFDHDVFYYSGGEVAGNSTFINYYGAGITGDGIYKSTDGGVTFSLLPGTGTYFDLTWRIAHSLADTNEVFVGTKLYGLWQTQNGGGSFINVLPNREISDIEVFPDGSILAASHHDGIYYSTTGDSSTFIEIAAGLPVTGFSRIEMAYCKTNPNYVYAIYELSSGDGIHSFWQSTDHGLSWTERQNPDLTLSLPFPWYCMMLFVDDNNPLQVITGGVDIGITFTGGTGWITGWNSHADYHIGFSDPLNPNYYYVGNDGGVHRYDVNFFGSTSYELNTGYNVTQFYAGTFFPDSVRFWAGTQDNGTQSGGPFSQSQNHIFGGDGAFCAINQQTDNEGYVSWQNGHIQKTLDAHSNYPTFYPAMNEMDADANGDIDDATWFINPFEINELDGQQLYFPTRNRVWRTINGTDNWEQLTNPISNIYSIGVSYDLDPIIYCGGTNKLYRIPSGINSTPGDQVSLISSIPSAVMGSSMTCISVSPQNRGNLFISLGNISTNPRIYKVTNANTSSPTWTSIHGDLPVGIGANWVDVSPYNENFIVLATDFGVFTTSNGGVNWILETDIPNVPVHQVKIRNSDLKVFVYTHGRGIWTADIPTTGMSLEQEVKNTTKIYPTITTGLVNIETTLDDYEVEVYCLDGKKIMSLKSVTQFNIDSALSGMYIVTISHGKKNMITQKIYLMHGY